MPRCTAALLGAGVEFVLLLATCASQIVYGLLEGTVINVHPSITEHAGGMDRRAPGCY
jgi:hypothetical protein